MTSELGAVLKSTSVELRKCAHRLFFASLCMAVVVGSSACRSREGTSDAEGVESSRASLAKVFDPNMEEGTIVQVTTPTSLLTLRGCDKPPDNSAAAGETLLKPRREAPWSRFGETAATYVLTQMPQADLTAAATAIQERYDQEVLAKLPVLPIVRIDVEPFTVNYGPEFTGLKQAVRVHGRRIVIKAQQESGTLREVVAYYVNYDRPGPGGPATLFLAAGRISRTRGTIEVDPSNGYGATVLGHLAAAGWPVVAYDDPGEKLEESLSDIRLIDRAILSRWGRVDAIGFTDSIFHYLAFHDSILRSAYVFGTYIPLWTRNDIPGRTGGPFGTNPATDNQTVQSRFQWADFVTIAASQNITLALQNNAGGSGLAKAGLLNELLPAVQRFAIPPTLLQVRGNDRNGDGIGDNNETCHEGETQDYLDFLLNGLKATT
jgi:hypothetical protein